MLLIIFGWLMFTIIVAVAANTRGRNALGWGILAVLFSPLIAGLLLLALPNLRMEALLSGGSTSSFGPLRTQEWHDQRQRRRNITRAVVLTLIAVVMIFKMVGWVVRNNDMPVVKTGDSAVVTTIEENGKPVQNAAIKKTR
jgi:hypothetical protein